MILRKLRFYFWLWVCFVFDRFISRKIKIPSSYVKKSVRLITQKKINIYFYATYNSAGTKVVISDVVPELKKKIKTLSLPWNVVFSNSSPKKAVDYLICFKTLPPNPVIGKPKIILSICDEGENFWGYLKKFDALVASSSIKFANLISIQNRNTYFISESENSTNISFGSKNLKKLPSERPCNLFWHGGPNSFSALEELKPHLIKLGEKRRINLLIVSGKKALHEYKWGAINVYHFPWSPENMLKCAKISRLGLIPARDSLRTSYLKPASRVRALYALGVPAIGDAAVPDLHTFSSPFDGPLAKGPEDFSSKINSFLNNPKLLNNLALNGFKHLSNKYSTQTTANQWINFFLEQERNQ
jgi:glycosyltransferase involved in cell wall biosynthesis